MSNISIPISGLNPLFSISSSDFIPLVQSSSLTTYRTTFTQVGNWISASVGASSSLVSVSASHSNFSDNSCSSSFASTSLTSSNLIYPNTSTASYSITSSKSISASFAQTTPIQVSGSWASASFTSTSASFASQSITSNSSITSTSSSYASSSTQANSALFATSATSATSASWASSSLNARSASYVSSAVYGPKFITPIIFNTTVPTNTSNTTSSSIVTIQASSYPWIVSASALIMYASTSGLGGGTGHVITSISSSKAASLYLINSTPASGDQHYIVSNQAIFPFDTSALSGSFITLFDICRVDYINCYIIGYY